MNIDTLSDELASLLKSDAGLADVKIVSAYPYSVRPSAIKESVIAIGFSDITLENCHLGSVEKAGEVKLFADIFVPVNSGSNSAHRIFVRICRALESMHIAGISAQRIYVDAHTQSYVMKTEITLKGKPELGGDGGE